MYTNIGPLKTKPSFTEGHVNIAKEGKLASESIKKQKW
jgi:hypothetical protein